MRVIRLYLDPFNRHGYLLAYLPDRGRLDRVLDLLLSRGWHVSRLPDLPVFALSMPDPVADDTASTKFLSGQVLSELLTVPLSEFNWIEVYPSAEEAYDEAAKDGRAWINGQGDYLIIDRRSGQVDYRSLDLGFWPDSGNFPKFSE